VSTALAIAIVVFGIPLFFALAMNGPRGR